MNNPTLKEQAHGEIEKIFRILLPQNGLAVREEQITLCHTMLDKGKHLCSMESLNETEIQRCFLTLYKKLAENRQEILGSYLRQLEELKDKDFMAHP